MNSILKLSLRLIGKDSLDSSIVCVSIPGTLHLIVASCVQSFIAPPDLVIGDSVRRCLQYEVFLARIYYNSDYYVRV